MVSGHPPASFVVIGECMLELVAGDSDRHLSYGGDTFNTALHLARLGEDVSYMTALGDDPFSVEMRAGWQTEGLRTELALIAPGRLPGLYAIRTDATGERSFYYWREQAAVRSLFELPNHEEALARAAQANTLYLSGITLALFDQQGRAKLADLARHVGNSGGNVAFDPNYRPSLWPSRQHAVDAIEAFGPLVTHVLTTFEDEVALHGDRDPEAAHARWREAGAREVVIKLGQRGCMINDGCIVSPQHALTPIDTTGAGDAFNAGYLAARRHGVTAHDAAIFANTLGGIAISYRGAVFPRSALPDLAMFVASAAIDT